MNENMNDEDDAFHQNIVSSGNIEIDRKMGGGIPIGSLCLVEGVNDSGKSVLVQQIMSGSLNQLKKILIYTTENTIKSLLKQMDSLGLDITDFFITGYAKIFPTNVKTGNIENKEGMLNIITESMKTRNEDIIILDSLTVFVVHSNEDEILTFFRECKNLCDNGKTIFITVHGYAFSEMLLVRIRSICDTHLLIKIEQVGDQLIKTMEIAKVRGAQRTTGNIISFDVDPHFGLKIIPISRTKA